MSEDDLIDRMTRGIRDKSMTEEEARAYARSALAELRRGGYAVVPMEAIRKAGSNAKVTVSAHRDGEGRSSLCLRRFGGCRVDLVRDDRISR